ncbi:hypothetical protein Tco_1470244, partial [Tanacetum coccineum]
FDGVTMCEEGRMKAISLMAVFPANYHETMPWASEKTYIYSVVENTCNEAKLYDLDETEKGVILAGNDALGNSSTTAHAWIPGFSLISLFQFLPFCLIKGNAKKQEKERRTCVDDLKYEESHVRIKCRSISKEKKSNYSSFQDLRSSCNKDMVKYEDPRPSTTRTRALNESFNKNISPVRTQPPGREFAARQEALPPSS